MISLLKDISIPTVSIIVIICTIAIVKELLLLIKAYRSKAAELVLEKELNEFDKRIEEFYLPLRERFKLTKSIANQTSKMVNNGEYDNSFLNIESDNPRALRDIIVLQIFLPLNKEIENIILNKFHWKHPDDDTNYDKILQHYIFWRTIENARTEDKIKKYYDAKNFLVFPQDEVDKNYKMCTYLLKERNEMRERIKNFRNYTTKQRGVK